MGGDILVPEGTFFIDSITISKACTFIGHGKNSSVIVVNNSTDNIGINVKSDGVNFKKLKVRSLELDGRYTNTNVTGINFDDGNGSIGYNTLEDVNFEGFSGRGLRIYNAIHVSIKNILTKACNNAIELLGVRGSYGTSVTIEDSYVLYNNKGLIIDGCHQGLLKRFIAESHDIGIQFTKSGGWTLVNTYFEKNRVHDVLSNDSKYTLLGTARHSSNIPDPTKSIWTNALTLPNNRTNNSYENSLATIKQIELYYQHGKGHKEISPYPYLKGSLSESDGIIYDKQRVIPVLTGNNLLKIDKWSQPFDPTTKGIKFRYTSAGAKYCSQAVNLQLGNYTFLASLKNNSRSVARVQLLDSVNTIINEYVIDELSYGNKTRKYVYFKFDIATVGDYTIRFYDYVPAGTELDVDIYGATLIANNTSYTEINDFGNSGFDTAMQNSMMLSQFLSHLREGYNLFGSGKKETYGSTIPTTGIWKVGDRQHNTIPTAGGYMGWVCITVGDFSGTPPVFKGFGLIQD